MCRESQLSRALTTPNVTLRFLGSSTGDTMQTLVGGAPLPNQPFPVIALRGGILFPGQELSLTIGRTRSLALVSTLHEGDIVGVVAQRNRVEDPSLPDLFE